MTKLAFWQVVFSSCQQSPYLVHLLQQRYTDTCAWSSFPEINKICIHLYINSRWIYFQFWELRRWMRFSGKIVFGLWSSPLKGVKFKGLSQTKRMEWRLGMQSSKNSLRWGENFLGLLILCNYLIHPISNFYHFIHIWITIELLPWVYLFMIVVNLKAFWKVKGQI